MSPKTKGESANLIRVRNNQRRSRARRREYVAELERKVHECNAQGRPSCAPPVDHQDTILRLERENQRLRDMSALAGVELDLVDTQLAAGGGADHVAANDNALHRFPETAPESASTAMKPIAGEVSMPNGSDEAESFLDFPTDDFDTWFEPLPLPDPFEPSYVSQTVLQSSSSLSYGASLALQDANPLCSVEFLLPASNQLHVGTTLCSVAYKMIREQNKRGIDMIEIGILLWNGFVKGEGSGGCKVENELLSNVLEYIKG